MLLIPCKFTVRPVSSREGELRPYTDGLRFADLLRPVLRGVHDRLHILQLIAAHPVVQDDIRVYADACVVEGLYRLDIFLFGAVLGPDGSLLVELAQVIHVIDAVSHVVLRCALVGRREPDIGNAVLCQAFGLGSAPLPPETVIGQIPFKILHHGLIISHVLSPLFLLQPHSCIPAFRRSIFLYSGEVYSCIREKYMSVFRRTVCGSGVCLIIFRTFYHRRGDLSNFGEKRGMPHWFRNENCGHKRSINCDMKNVSIRVDPMRERLHEQRTEKPGQCRNCTVRAAGCI